MENVIEKYRMDNHLSCEDIAQKAGLSSRTVVYAHCRGLRAISAETAVKYHKALGIPLSALRPDLWGPNSNSQDREG